jgi:hypothetical protein
MTSSASSRRGTESQAVTRQVFSPFSSIRFARSGFAPFGSLSRGLRTISVKRVAPSLRSTVPLPDSSSDRKSNLKACATARKVNMKQVSTAASRRCSGLHASLGRQNPSAAPSVTAAPRPLRASRNHLDHWKVRLRTYVAMASFCVHVLWGAAASTHALPSDLRGGRW